IFILIIIMGFKETYDKIGTSKQIVLFLSFLGGFDFGYNTGVISGSLPRIVDKYDINVVIQGLIASSIIFGAMIGAVGGGILADRIGRKPVILLMGACTTAGAVASAAIGNIAIAAPMRIILGLGVGAESSICPLMVAEVVPENKRGRWGSLFQISITIGLLIGTVMGVILKRAPHNYRWRKQHERDRVKEKNEKSMWAKLREKKNRRPMMMGVILAVLSQWTGINAFMYFSRIIFEFAGFDQEYGPLVGASILQVWNVLTTLVAMVLVDRVGRRILLFVGAIVMTASNFFIALFFVTLKGDVRGWLSIVCLFTFVAAFEASIGTLFWFVINEILDDDIKNIGAPIINALQWFFNLSLTFFFISAVTFLGKSTMFWVFFAIGLGCTTVLWIFLPPKKVVTMGVANQDQNNSDPYALSSDDPTPKEGETPALTSASSPPTADRIPMPM
ncbi:hypothetical protein SAMD00019534_052150, partial [Acytostelium subglobosum LB1]|uniref:hypothetical protein n=1 Tax=Acytostelium subglobosum LB1 TaxID=1410327 RepID=UPI00064508F0